MQRKVNSVVVFSTEVHHGGKLTRTDSEEQNRQRKIEAQKKDGGGKNRGIHTKQEERQRRTYKAKRQDGGDSEKERERKKERERQKDGEMKRPFMDKLPASITNCSFVVFRKQ